jgi:hypothetical protein
MAESVDAQFAHSRFSAPLPLSSPSTLPDRSSQYNGREGFFQYINESPSSYRDTLVDDGLDVAVHQYLQVHGPSEWSDLISFITLLNQSGSSSEARRKSLESFDITLFLRSVMLESFFINQNGWMLDGASYSLFYDHFNDIWRLVLHHGNHSPYHFIC